MQLRSINIMDYTTTSVLRASILAAVLYCMLKPSTVNDVLQLAADAKSKMECRQRCETKHQEGSRKRMTMKTKMLVDNTVIKDIEKEELYIIMSPLLLSYVRK